MAAITAALVKELREKTGAGMMDCKTALVETGGDLEAAIDWLRTKGLAKAAKKAGRAAAEGLIGIAGGQKAAAMIELNSETDFVARNEQFQALVREAAETALGTDGSLEAVLAAQLASTGKSVDDSVKDAVATIGENMTLRRAARMEVAEGHVANYVHGPVAPGLGKIGVLVALSSTAGDDALSGIGRQIAMHIAATSPLAATVEELDPAIVEKERDVLAAEARESGKPEQIIDKMVEGRIRKFYEEIVLMKQTFVVNPDLTVEQALDEAAKAAGAPIKLEGFALFKLGEGVEKDESDFAAEVAAAVQG